MFYRIINNEPIFPHRFSPEACNVIGALLSKSPTARLGSSSLAAKEIMQSPFFSTVDFDNLLRQDAVSPFKPDLDANDLKYYRFLENVSFIFYRIVFTVFMLFCCGRHLLGYIPSLFPLLFVVDN